MTTKYRITKDTRRDGKLSYNLEFNHPEYGWHHLKSSQSFEQLKQEIEAFLDSEIIKTEVVYVGRL